MRQARFLAVILLVNILASLVYPFSVFAAFNPQINYQGKLTDDGGVTVADGTYRMYFRLYTTATGATTSAIWQDDRLTNVGDRITVTNGLFSVMLGSSTPLTGVNFNQTLYLGVEVCGTTGVCDGEMTPRKVLGAVPAAFVAKELDGSTDIGIGTTTPFGQLHVASSTRPQFVITDTGGGANAKHWYASSTNGDLAWGVLNDGLSTLTERLRFTSAGNVGIGTTSPYRKLSVAGDGVFTGSLLVGTTTNHQLVIGGSASSTAMLIGAVNLKPKLLVNDDSAVGESFAIRRAGDNALGSGIFGSKSRGTFDAPTIVEDGDALFAFSGLGHSGSGTQGFNQGASIEIQVDGTPGVTDLPGRIMFSTTPDGSSSVTERMRIDNKGRVGINDASPHELAMLTVSGTTTDSTGYSVRFQDSADTELFSVRNDGVGYFSARLGVATSAPGTTFAVDGSFNVRNNTATSTFDGNGINLVNGGCYAVSGVCLTSSSITGSGFAGMLTSWTSASVLTATSAPTAAYYVATSSTATSTFAGGMKVGNNSLVVTSSVGRVSLATTSTEYNLTIDGNGSATNIGLVTAADSTANQLVFKRGLLSSYVGLTATNQFDFFTGESIPFVFTTGGGTEVFRISQNGVLTANVGNVGIGTTSPYAKLSVVGQVVAPYYTATSTTATSTFAGILAVGTTTPVSSPMFVVGTSSPVLFVGKNSPNVGIHTNNTGFTLNGTNYSASLNVRNASAGNNSFNARFESYGIGSYLAATRANGTQAAPTIIGDGQRVFELFPTGYDGTDYEQLGGIAFETDDTDSVAVGNNDMPGRIIFTTTPDGTNAPLERMRIDNKGRVGINTSGSGLDFASTLTVNTYTDDSTGYGLMVQNSGATELFTVRGDGLTTMAGNAYIVGSLGIGTATPAQQLSVANRLYVGGSGTSTFENNLEVGGNLRIGTSTTFIGKDFISVSNLFNVLANGNVGIGTTSPYSKLSVVGTTTSAVFVATTTATSTSNGGWNIASGCFAISGVCVGGSNFTGSGFANMLTSWTSASGLTATSGPTASYFIATSTTGTSTFAGLVGVGTTTPAATFAVTGSGYFTDRLGVGTNSTADKLVVSGGNVLVDNARGLYSYNAAGSASAALIIANSSNNVSVGESSVWGRVDIKGLTALHNGNVGIGTTTPYAPLSVVGQVVGSYFTATSTTGTSTFAGRVGIGTTSPFAKLAIVPTTGAHEFVIASSSSSTVASMFVDSLGRTALGSYNTTFVSGGSTAGSALTISRSTPLDVGPLLAEYSLFTTERAGTVQPLWSSLRSRGHLTNKLAVQGDDKLWTIAGYGFDGTDYNESALIEFEVDGAVASDDVPGRIIFKTAALGAGSGSERLRIDNQGRVAINDSTPNELSMLTVSGTTSDDTGYSVRFQNSGEDPLFSVRNDGIGYFSNLVGIGVPVPTLALEINGIASSTNFYGNVSDTGAAPAYTWGSDPDTGIFNKAANKLGFTTAGAEAMLIDDSGNLLVGTSSTASSSIFVIDSANTAIPTDFTLTNSAFTSSITGRVANMYVRANSASQRDLWQFWVDKTASNYNDIDWGFKSNNNAGTLVDVLYVDGSNGGDFPRLGWNGTTTPFGRFVIEGSSAGTPDFAVWDTGVSAPSFVVQSSAPTQSRGVGVGTTTPWRAFSVVGTVGFSSTLSAESGNDNVLCIDPTTFEVTDGGAACGASSLRFKENIEDLNHGLNDVLALRPVSYEYKKGERRAGDDNRYLGFIAEEMIDVIPEVVEIDSEGLPGGIDYAKLAPVLTKAIQELYQSLQNLTGQTITYITATFDTLFAKEVKTDKLCVGNTCVTADEFLAIVQNAGAEPVVPNDPISINTSTTTDNNTSTSTGPVDGTEPIIEEDLVPVEPEPEVVVPESETIPEPAPETTPEPEVLPEPGV